MAVAGPALRRFEPVDYSLTLFGGDSPKVRYFTQIADYPKAEEAGVHRDPRRDARARWLPAASNGRAAARALPRTAPEAAAEAALRERWSARSDASLGARVTRRREECGERGGACRRVAWGSAPRARGAALPAGAAVRNWPAGLHPLRRVRMVMMHSWSICAWRTRAATSY